MRRFLLSASFAGLLLAAPFASAPAVAQEAAHDAARSMSPAERKAVESVIESYLISNPQVIERALQALEAKRKADEERAAKMALNTYREELFEDASVPVGGNASGDVTIVEFFDYRCGVCKRVHPIVTELMKTDPNIRLVYKEWPILGPDSVFAARAALAARAQDKYLVFHEALMTYRGQLDQNRILRIAVDVGLDAERLQRDMGAPEIAKIISRNYALAEALRINGTPSFIVGDQLIRGGRDLRGMRLLVANARAGGNASKE